MKLSIRKALRDPEARRVMEKDSLRVMIGIYCRGRHHSPKGQLCPTCQEFEAYALARTDRCPFMATKSFCSACKVHCYNKQWRPYVKEVMRYAGPRMLFHHPVLAILHSFVMLRMKVKNRRQKTEAPS